MSETNKFSIGRAEVRIGRLPWWKRLLNKVGFNFIVIKKTSSIGVIDQVDVTLATEAMVEGEDKPTLPVDEAKIFTPEYDLCSRALREASEQGTNAHAHVKRFFMSRKRDVPILGPLQREQLSLNTNHSLDTINMLFSPKDRYGNERRV